MAFRKNVKRIDPRYFLHETVNRNDDGSVFAEAADQIGPWQDRGPTGTVTMPAVDPPDPEDEDELPEIPSSDWQVINPPSPQSRGRWTAAKKKTPESSAQKELEERFLGMGARSEKQKKHFWVKIGNFLYKQWKQAGDRQAMEKKKVAQQIYMQGSTDDDAGVNVRMPKSEKLETIAFSIGMYADAIMDRRRARETEDEDEREELERQAKKAARQAEHGKEIAAQDKKWKQSDEYKNQQQDEETRELQQARCDKYGRDSRECLGDQKHCEENGGSWDWRRKQCSKGGSFAGFNESLTRAQLKRIVREEIKRTLKSK